MARRGRVGRADAARRLAEAWLSGERRTFHGLADDAVEGGDDGLIEDAAVAVAAGADEDEAREMLADVMKIAEMGYVAFGKREIASMDVFAIVVMPVAGAPVPHEAIRSSLERSGMFPDDIEILLAAGWCEVAEVAGLPATAVRRLLNELSCGREPTGVAMRATPAPSHPVALVGVALRACQDDEADEERSILQDCGDDDVEADYEAWRAGITGHVGRLVVDAVRPCTPSTADQETRVHAGCMREERGDHGSPWPLDDSPLVSPRRRIVH